MSINREAIPAAMLPERRWCVWRIENSSTGKPTKIPHRADGRGKASSTDPTTWSTFDEAIRTAEHGDYAGIGFMLGDGWAGIDLDDCLNDTGSYSWGSEIIGAFDSYAEISPSGTGVKIFIRGQKPEGVKACSKRGFGPEKIGKLEIYDHDRFFAVTGNVLDGKPMEVVDCNGNFTSLCEQYLRNAPVSENSGNRTASPDLQYRRCLGGMLGMDMTDSGDGSRRLYACTCRCVEHGLTDPEAVRCIREYARSYPFPTTWTDAQIVDRIRDAEKRTQRGSVCCESITPEPLGTIWSTAPDLREPIIEGLLRRGEVGNLISTSKSYKTYLILNLAICLAIGRQWLERFSCKAGKVLIIDLELQKPSITKRTLDIARAMHVPDRDIAEQIEFVSLRGRNATIEEIERLILKIEPRTYSAIIIDPLYKTYPPQFDENSNAQMTQLYRRWERMAEHLDGALIIIHHGSKGNQSDKRVVDVGSGASAQSRSADCHIALREHEQPDAVVLECRVRSFAPVDPMVIRWAYPLWQRDLGLNPEDLKTGRKARNADATQPPPKEKPEPWTVERFVNAFITPAAKSAATIEVEAEAIGLSARKAKSFLAAAIDAGKAHLWTYGGHKPKRYAAEPQPLLEAKNEGD